MRINKDYLIDRVASKDPTWPAIQTMELVDEGTQAYLVATNRSSLAKVPVTLEHGDTLGKVSAAALAAARKEAARTASEATLQVNGAQVIPDGPTFPRPTIESHGHFPNFETVWPQAPATFSIALDAAQLLTLARALGTSLVTLEFVDATTAVRVTGKPGAQGLLLPCKV